AKKTDAEQEKYSTMIPKNMSQWKKKKEGASTMTSIVKKRDASAKKKKYAMKKKRDATKKSEVVVKKRKLDSGVHSGSSSHPNKRARNCERETTSPMDPQRDLFPEPSMASPSQPTSKPHKSSSQPKI
ncbi:hypothetical protein HID58_023849, partial [Brassica napus]